MPATLGLSVTPHQPRSGVFVLAGVFVSSRCFWSPVDFQARLFQAGKSVMSFLALVLACVQHCVAERGCIISVTYITRTRKQRPSEVDQSWCS